MDFQDMLLMVVATEGGGGSAAAAPTNLYNVATNCQIPDTNGSGMTFAMTRTAHKACGDLTSIQTVYADWYTSPTGGLDTDVSSTVTRATAIEYPAGTFTAVTANYTTDANKIATSPAITVSIPDGATFWVRTKQTGTNMCYRNGQTNNIKLNTTTGIAEGFEFLFGGSGTDKTTSGTVGNTNGTALPGIWPIHIIGQTAKKSVLIVGDSIASGVGDTYDTTGGNLAIGYIGRALGPAGIPYSRCAVSGTLLNDFMTSHTRRSAMAVYYSDIILEYGVNDDSGGVTIANMKTNVQNFAAISDFSGKRIYVCTLTPESTSTDSFATTANQTPKSGWGAGSKAALYNDWVRAGGITGITDFFEIADLVEDSRNNGKWKAPGYTSEGVHPLKAGHVAASAGITTALFT